MKESAGKRLKPKARVYAREYEKTSNILQRKNVIKKVFNDQ